MRQFLPCLAVAASLIACSNSASMSGTIHVAPGHAGMGVYAMLLQQATQPADPVDPTQVQIPVTGQLTIVGYRSVGVASDNGGDFTYNFNQLDKGWYTIGAFLDSGVDPQPDINKDVHWEEDNQFFVDPNGTPRQATDDICIGMSCPDRATIKGTLHISANASQWPTAVVWQNWRFGVARPSATDSFSPKQHVTFFPATGVAGDIPFVLFNVPLESVYLWADANVNNDAQGVVDLFGLPRVNPITLDANNREVDNVDIWLDRQAPDLGSISGTVTLSGALANAHLEIDVFSNNPTQTRSPTIVGVLELDAAGKVSVPFQLPSLPIGPLYLLAFLQTSVNGSTVSTYGAYSSTGTGATAITLTTDAPAQNGIDVALGVSLVSGTVTLAHVPTTPALSQVFVLATDPTKAPPDDVIDGVQLAVTQSNGSASLSYQLFGLVDGTYNMTLVPDTSHDGNYTDERAAHYGFKGTPAQISIVAGGRQRSDFNVDMAAP